jgi:hypothetical protein
MQPAPLTGPLIHCGISRRLEFERTGPCSRQPDRSRLISGLPKEYQTAIAVLLRKSDTRHKCNKQSGNCFLQSAFFRAYCRDNRHGFLFVIQIHLQIRRGSRVFRVQLQ